MNRYVVFTVLLAYALVFFGYAALGPEEVNWDKTYQSKGTQPFDTKVLYDRIDDVLSPSEKSLVYLPIYNTLKSSAKDNSVYINIESNFRPSQLDIDVLLNYLYRGNTAFISASELSYPLLDSLGISTSKQIMPEVEWTENGPIAATKIRVSSIPDSSYAALTEWGYSYFDDSSIMNGAADVLGTAGESDPVFIRVEVGDGELYLHTVPSAFSNYFMLYSDIPQYVAAAMSYLPEHRHLYWNNYRLGMSRRGGVLGVLGRSDGFKIAYWLSLCGILIFIVFTAKRRQRMVPVLAPPRNTGLDFVNTMGDLYFNSSKHKDLAEKKLTYLKDYIRSRYRMSVDSLDDRTADRLAVKSNKTISEIKELFNEFNVIDSLKIVRSKQLLALQEKLDRFYERT